MRLDSTLSMDDNHGRSTFGGSASSPNKPFAGYGG